MRAHGGAVQRYDPGMNEYEELVRHTELLVRAMAETKRLLVRFKVVPQTRLPKLFALIVLNEMMRKCDSVVAMSKAAAWSGISSVTRSAFESYADLVNLLLEKEDYANYMMWSSLNQQRSQFQSMIDHPDSRYTGSLNEVLRAKQSDPRAVLAETRSHMDTLANDLPTKY